MLVCCDLGVRTRGRAWCGLGSYLSVFVNGPGVHLHVRG